MPDATCLIEGCDSPQKARGWCTKHYARWQKYGDPLHLERVFIAPGDECKMTGCTGQVAGLGLCGKHYFRQRKHGDPNTVLVQRGVTPEERFWSKVDKDGPVPDYAPHLGGCWVWRAALDTQGYGQFGIDGRLVLVHRYSYGLAHSAIPGDLPLDHLCRVHACVNPAHLEPVTHLVNVHRGADARIIERGGKCVNGHDVTPDNIYWKANGRPACRTCVLEAQRRFRQRKGVSGAAA